MIARTATNLRQLEDLAKQTGTGSVKYASELWAVLDAVDAVDMPGEQGEAHAVYIGPRGGAPCIFRGRLNITRRKIMPVRLNAYEIALERTIVEVRNETRDRGTGNGDFIIKWVAE